MRRRLIVMFAVMAVTLAGLLATGAPRGTHARSTTGRLVSAAVGPGPGAAARPGDGRTPTILSPAVTGWRTCLVGGAQVCGVQSACTEDVDATVRIGHARIGRAHCPSTPGLRVPLPPIQVRPGHPPAASGIRPHRTP